MKKIYLLTAIICFFYSCNIKEQSEIQKEVMASTEVIEVDVDDLVKSFVKDSTAAAEKYVGKVLSVKGKVAVFEQIDTLTGHVNDSLPGPIKWLAHRIINDIQSSNIFFEELGKTNPTYNVQATFAKEYRKELVGIKEKSKVTVKGKLEHISTLSQVLPDSSKKTLLYTLSLQGCVIEKK
ncbi:OB-fold protein [Cytophaga aurantiaca]|uniref:OB-fold protein n=1 Tax=Cytophaga aurantiaca TaxID=29530 RepID=UPI000373CD13|nr:hypothetical protein [Cytophaga aurantiaca]